MSTLYKNLKVSERICMMLKDTGWWKYDTKGKYVIFNKVCRVRGDGTNPEGIDKMIYLFVGKNGAVRKSDKPNVTGTYSVTEQYKSMLENYDKKMLA